MIFEVFNELFGEGTDRKLFGDKTNIVECSRAYTELLNEVEQLDSANAKIITSMFSVPKKNKPPKQNNKHKKNQKRKKR